MTELLNNYLHIIVLYFPIGAIGIYRWSVWVAKKVVAKKYRPVTENGYSNTLSIVVPVYNEDPNIFEKALKSWISNKPDEIIAVIDHTDAVCIERFKKFQEENKNSTLIVTQRPGKRGALSDGIKVAQYNIIALVDSDTIWDPNIKNTLLSPFIDPLVGGVGPRQDVLNTNTLARRLFNIHLDNRYFDEITYLATVGNALTCLSGRTALYRKEAIKDLCDELENETFLGVKCISGDDKCLTRLVQERGWKVRYQANARVLTPGAPDLFTLFKQHLRWSRNSYRSDLKSLMSKWIWKKEKFLAYHMIDAKSQPFTLIIGPIYFIFSIIWGYWLIAGILLMWWHFSRGIKLYAHLRHHPSDILILPFYIFTTYLMAILKIYAMVTIRRQGWITRWNKDRLQTGVGIVFRALKSTMSYFVTASIIILLGFGVVKYKLITAPISNYSSSIAFIDAKNIDPSQYKQTILDNLKNQQFGFYSIKENDNLSKIARRYNVNPAVIIKANSETIQNSDHIYPGQLIVIPVSELRNTLDKNNLVSGEEPGIIFDEASNTINVKGEGSVVNLPKIYEALKNENILEKLDNNEWILRANLFIGDGVILVLDDESVSWLKLKSDTNWFVWLKSRNGNILVQNTKVTSWDEDVKLPDNNTLDGRSFILAEDSGRMDIVNSEISFLGYQNDKEIEQSGGGLSGISWKVRADVFGKNILTGNVMKSKIHDNYFGMYIYGATGMVIENNEVFNNTQYGIDTHDGSSNLLINYNSVYANGSHGIILSKHVVNNRIIGNKSFNNKLHGIMLDQQSNNNQVESNIIYDNVDGIVLYDSHNNLIRNNEIRESDGGIRVNNRSSKNYIEQNKITSNKNGVFIYDNSNNNFVVGNFIKNNTKGVYIKKAFGNLIKDSLKNGYNGKEIELNEANDNLIQKIQ